MANQSKIEDIIDDIEAYIDDKWFINIETPSGFVILFNNID